MKSNENSEGGNFHHLLSCHLARERFRTFSTLFLTDNKYEIIISGPPKSVPISQITSCLPVYKCQTCRQKPKCNIWQWPFIWKKKTSHKSHSIIISSEEYLKIRSFLSRSDLKNWCFYLGKIIIIHWISELQLVQNTAALLLTNIRGQDHLSRVLVSHHWLPVIIWIDFRILLIAFKALHGAVHSYCCSPEC